MYWSVLFYFIEIAGILRSSNLEIKVFQAARLLPCQHACYLAIAA